MSLWGHEYLWKVVEKFLRLQESQCYSCLQEGQKGGHKEWQMKQPQLKLWESNGETSGNCFQTHKGREGDHEQAARICNAWPPCKEITDSAHERRTVNAYLDLYKTSSIASHNSFMDKLMKYRLEKWPVKWTECWLSFGAARALINGTKSSWRPATSSSYTAATAASTA